MSERIWKNCNKHEHSKEREWKHKKAAQVPAFQDF